MKKRLIFTHPLPLTIDHEMSQLFDIETIPFEQLVKQDMIEAHGLISILSDDLSATNLKKFPKLEVIAQYAVGFNNIDLLECQKRGITVCHTPDVLTQATADLAFAMLTSLARKIPEAQKAARDGQWRGWSASDYLGKNLEGAQLGIIGLGEIGSAMAKLCQQSYAMDIFYHNTKPTPKAQALGAKYLSLEELCSTCDIISLHTPLTTKTKHLIGAKELSLMKPDAILINTARGQVIDQKALCESLKQEKFFGVGLDVTTPEPLAADHELYQYSKVLITPHIGSAQQQTRENMAWLCWRNAQEVLENREAITAVKDFS